MECYDVRWRPIAMTTTQSTFRALIALGLVIACCNALHASSALLDDKEIQIRAAYLLNFMKFTTWPDEAFISEDSALILAMVGEDPFGRVLEQTFSRERVGGKKIEVQRMRIPARSDYRTEDAYEQALARILRRLRDAHIVHFTNCQPDDLDRVFNHVDTSRILTVGDHRRCAEQRTALAIDRDGDRVIFYANVGIIDSLDLQVSSRLLSLARIINDSGSGR